MLWVSNSLGAIGFFLFVIQCLDGVSLLQADISAPVKSNFKQFQMGDTEILPRLLRIGNRDENWFYFFQIVDEHFHFLDAIFAPFTMNNLVMQVLWKMSSEARLKIQKMRGRNGQRLKWLIVNKYTIQCLNENLLFVFCFHLIRCVLHFLYKNIFIFILLKKKLHSIYESQLWWQPCCCRYLVGEMKEVKAAMGDGESAGWCTGDKKNKIRLESWLQFSEEGSITSFRFLWMNVTHVLKITTIQQEKKYVPLRTRTQIRPSLAVIHEKKKNHMQRVCVFILNLLRPKTDPASPK